MNFIKRIINNDLLSLRIKKDNLKFRFPPEPNGYLHIGHAKAIFINFNLARHYNVKFILRFDDTNPVNEKDYFINSIKYDLLWLGCRWNQETYTSDYFQILYEWAILLIKQGYAYIDDQPQDIINNQRLSDNINYRISPYRDRSINENLILFKKMKLGYFKEGDCVLRAKIDVNSPNIHYRDPIMYRIIYKVHNRTKDNWIIFPTYDWAHGQSDYIERISHSLCSIEFQNHRDLYNWYLNLLYTKGVKPKQIEFSRLNISYTLMSKRILNMLVNEKVVSGWDDPRLPTISGLRRRGYSSESIKNFCYLIGISKREKCIDLSLLEFCVRNHLNKISIRVIVIINPVKIIIENYLDNHYEYCYFKNRNKDNRMIFSKFLYIERSDFQEYPSDNFYRLCLGGYVKLKDSYIIKANKIIKNSEGDITEIYCTYYNDIDKFKDYVKSVIHWVSSLNYFPIKIRLYYPIYKVDNPWDYLNDNKIFNIINTNTVKVLTSYAEKYLLHASYNQHYQFIRNGYFILDKDSCCSKSKLIFNRTVKLKKSYN